MTITSTKAARRRPNRLPTRVTPGQAEASDGESATDLRPRFLIIGDRDQVDPALRSVFRKSYNIMQIESPAEALRALGTHGADVVLLDQRLITHQGQSAEHVTVDDTGTVVWMSIDTKAVKLLGDFLKALASDSASGGQRATKTSRPAVIRKRRRGGDEPSR